MRLRLALAFAVIAIAINQLAVAQYPDKPVTILTGYGPGSPGDRIARGLAKAALTHFPQPILVMNRPGEGGTLAISEALRAKPDGYVVGLGTAGNLTVQPHVSTLQYAGPDTYVPVAKLVTQPNVLMIRGDARWKTAGEFLAYAKSHPAEITVGVAGLATIAHPEFGAAQARRQCRRQSRVLRWAATGPSSTDRKGRCGNCRGRANPAACSERKGAIVHFSGRRDRQHHEIRGSRGFRRRSARQLREEWPSG